MIKILLIEDHYQSLVTTATRLESEGYKVTKATGIAAAEDFFPGAKLHKGFFDGVIIDLNMDNTYLEFNNEDGSINVETTEELRDKTIGGSLTGWIWWYYVARKKLTNNPKLFVFSAFTNELESKMNSIHELGIDADEHSYYENSIKVVTKEAYNGALNTLVKVLAETFNRDR